ncbi:DgyrCDS9323 [Dimorphilus gyrociliatus]|uniref:DgyrCDS9323 n=1 Tax=Dimorphilus gyrociliatus TaxID=2664684 RepID=A0A7I8VYD3_9ANNE|nr:DgyrCDS9323 [Dimorphilus gyrociliatus]
MLTAAKALNLPVVVTEQYPKGLGHTVKELDVKGFPIIEKTQFSMCTAETREHLKSVKNLNSVLLCGIEAHACVQQTAFDLLEDGYDVHILADAVSSRSMVDRMLAFRRMENAGAFITTSESVLLMLCKDAAHPKFKEVQKCIWEVTPDSAILSGQIE